MHRKVMLKGHKVWKEQLNRDWGGISSAGDCCYLLITNVFNENFKILMIIRTPRVTDERILWFFRFELQRFYWSILETLVLYNRENCVLWTLVSVCSWIDTVYTLLNEYQSINFDTFLRMNNFRMRLWSANMRNSLMF